MPSQVCTCDACSRPRPPRLTLYERIESMRKVIEMYRCGNVLVIGAADAENLVKLMRDTSAAIAEAGQWSEMCRTFAAELRRGCIATPVITMTREVATALADLLDTVALSGADNGVPSH